MPSQGDPPPWDIGGSPVDHVDAVDDGTHAHTQSTPGTVWRDGGEVGLRVKGDSLVAWIIAHHIALATVDAHVLVNHGHGLLRVVQVIIGPNTWESLAYHLLQSKKPPSI